MASFSCVNCRRLFTKRVAACPECGSAAIMPADQSGGGKSALSRLRSWSAWIVAGLLVAWIGLEVVSPGTRAPADNGVARVPAATGLPQPPWPSSSSGEAAAPTKDSVPSWATAASSSSAEAPAPQTSGLSASAVRDELLRIGENARLDVGSAEGPLEGWLASGTEQQRENRIRLTRVLMRCARELQWDGADPKTLQALRECEDRSLAQSVR
jgi:hypothetical protein